MNVGENCADGGDIGANAGGCAMYCIICGACIAVKPKYSSFTSFQCYTFTYPPMDLHIQMVVVKIAVELFEMALFCKIRSYYYTYKLVTIEWLLFTINAWSVR